MKSLHALFLATAVAAMANIPIHAAGAAKVGPEHLAALTKFRTDYAQSLLEGRPEAVEGYFAAEIRLMPEFQRTVLGRDDALKYYQALAARFAVQAYRRDVIDVLDLGTRLVETGRFTQRLEGKGQAPTYDLNGKYLDLWEKTADGRLLLVTQTWNYDHQVEQGDALRFADVPAVVAAFQRRTPVTDNISLELAALGHLIEATVSLHDAPVFSRLYADDAILLPNYGPLCQGRKEIDAYVTHHFGQQLSVFEKLDIRNDRIDALDGYVIEYASHVASWKNSGWSGVNSGKNLRIWRREPDHSLKIIVQLGTYD